MPTSAEATVKSNLRRVMAKWQVRDRVEVLIRATQTRLVRLEFRRGARCVGEMLKLVSKQYCQGRTIGSRQQRQDRKVWLMVRPWAGKRWLGLVGAFGLATLLGVTGCSSLGTPCTAVAWFNELTITLTGDFVDVTDVKLCIEDQCAPVDGSQPPAALSQVKLAEQDGSTGTWVFKTGMSSPENFTVRVYTADGTVLSDTPAEPQWVRVGGSEECGGPGEATLTVHI